MEWSSQLQGLADAAGLYVHSVRPADRTFHFGDGQPPGWRDDAAEVTLELRATSQLDARTKIIEGLGLDRSPDFAWPPSVCYAAKGAA